MVASYPGTVRVFTSKADITDTVYAEHPNSLQDEVIALERTVGLNPHLSTTPSPSGTFTATSTLFDSVATRLANIETGIVADSHNQYVRKTGGDVVQAGSASTVGLRVRGATSQTADLLQLLSGTGSTVAAFSADGSLTVNNLTVNGTQTNVAGSATALDLGATTGIAAGTGTNVGDKIQLYSSTIGFGVAAARLVAFVPANAYFAVRQKAPSGYASSGDDAVLLGSDGTVTGTGAASFTDVVAASRSLPRGYVGGASLNTSVTTTTTEVVVKTFTVTLLAGRRYKFCFYGWLFSSAANDRVGVRIRENNTSGTIHLDAALFIDLALPAIIPVSAENPESGLSAGTKTFVGTVVRLAGSGTVGVQNGTVNAQFWVEDLGGV